jgi:hypothetical protein
MRTEREGRRAGELAAIAVSLSLLAGCGQPPEAEPEPIAPPPIAVDECSLFPEAATGESEVEVALLDPVSPASAPRPGNEAERLLFRQSYETLVRIDCRGAVQPGLAESWRAEADGRAWRFVLRRDAVFWDGRAVTPAAVVASWSRGGGSIRFDSLAADGDRELVVYLDSAYEEVPALFADPEHAVAGGSGSTWLPGSGPYRLEAPAPAIDFSHLVVNAFPVDAARPRLAFRLATATDARDLLDSGVELMVSRDPDILDYVGRRPELSARPLPWNRTYVLLAPTRVRELRSDATAELPRATVTVLPPEFQSALARDAVRGDARGHDGPAWWEVGDRCQRERERLHALPPAIPTAAYRLSGPWRVVHRQDDEAARGLAERIVALTTANESGPLAAAVPRLAELDEPPVVAGLEPDRFEEALRAGSEFLFVVALPHRALDPCRHLTLLSQRAPWLAVGWLDPARTIVPLVDTRSHLIAREGAVWLSVEWDGVVRIASDDQAGNVP